jgi:transcriptional regulator with XRE-family HTH domain
VHPKDFAEKYDLTQEELAELLGVSASLAKKWFSRSSPRLPEQRHMDRLGEIDTLVETYKLLIQLSKTLAEKLPPHIRQLLDLP